MLIKDKERKTCKNCKAVRYSGEDVYGCDECRKEITFVGFRGNEQRYLDLTVLYKSGSPGKHHQFCSWKCLRNYLPKIKTNYYKMPYGLRAKDFIDLFCEKKSHKFPRARTQTGAFPLRLADD